MKKLTASIFTVLLGVVSVNVADAAVASKGYVDQEVGKANTAIAAETSARTTAVSGLQESIDAINNADTGILAQSKGYTDGQITELRDDLTGATTDLSGLSSKVDTNAENIGKNTSAIGVLNGDVSTAGSVAKSIADALVDYSTTSEVESKISTATANMEVTTNKLSVESAENLTDEQWANVSLYPSMDTATKMIDYKIATNNDDITGAISDVSNAKVSIAQESANQAMITDAEGNVTTGQIATGMIADANVTEAKLEQNVQTALGLARTAKQNFNELTVAEVAEAGKAIVAVSETNGMVTATVGEITGAGITDGTVLKADLDSGVQASLDLADSALQSENVNWLAKNLNVPTECSDATNYCVLTYNNTGFVWEVIARGTEGDNAGK